MKKFEIIILVVIGFLVIILCCSLLITSSIEWKINVLDVPNIVRRNPLTVQSGIEKAVMLREFEIRIAAFQILSPKGELILDRIAQLWHEKGLLQAYSTGFKQKDIYLQFNDKRVEAWTDADKFFTASGEIIIRLLDDNGQMIAIATAEADIDYQPYLIK